MLSMPQCLLLIPAGTVELDDAVDDALKPGRVANGRCALMCCDPQFGVLRKKRGKRGHRLAIRSHSPINTKTYEMHVIRYDSASTSANVSHFIDELLRIFNFPRLFPFGAFAVSLFAE